MSFPHSVLCCQKGSEKVCCASALFFLYMYLSCFFKKTKQVELKQPRKDPASKAAHESSLNQPVCSQMQHHYYICGEPFYSPGARNLAA